MDMKVCKVDRVGEILCQLRLRAYRVRARHVCEVYDFETFIVDFFLSYAGRTVDRFSWLIAQLNGDVHCKKVSYGSNF